MKSGYCQVSGEYCDSLDEHHIIPREFGGLNGPTMFLTPTIHQTIHRIYRDDAKVAKFISRYPNSAYKIRQLVMMLRYASESLTRVEGSSISISMNSFSDFERKALTENANRANITVSELIVEMVKKVLGSFQKK